MVGVFAALQYVPVDRFKRRPAQPQPPQVGAGFLAVGLNALAVAVIVQPFCKFRTLLFAFKRRGVLLNLIPGNKHCLVLRLSVFRSQVFLMEEVAGTVCRALIDDHGIGLVEHTRRCRSHDLLGRLSFGLLPQSHLGQVHQVIVTATCRVGFLGGTDLDFAVTLRYALYIAGLSDAHQFRLPLVVFLAHAVHQAHRVMADHAVEHVLYLG